MSSKPILYYKFKSDNRWMTIEARDTWTNIRFLIEKKHGMQDVKVTLGKPNREYAYVEGYHSDENGTIGDRITDGEWLNPNVKIVLTRNPMPQRYGPYVPEAFRTYGSGASLDKESKPLSLSSRMTEDEMIAAVVDHAGTSRHVPSQRMRRYHRQESSAVHFSNIANGTTKKPSPSYSCYNCGMAGDHLAYACPHKKGTNHKPVHKRKLPSGIPLSCFRDAVTEEEKQSAYLGPQGRLLVEKKLAEDSRNKRRRTDVAGNYEK